MKMFEAEISRQKLKLNELLINIVVIMRQWLDNESNPAPIIATLIHNVISCLMEQKMLMEKNRSKRLFPEGEK